MTRAVSIRVEEASLSRGGRVLARGLGIALAPGAYLEIAGPNGSGKTTLLRCLAGIGRLAAGKIAFWENGAALDPDAQRQALHWLGHRDGLKGPISAGAHLSYWQGLLAAPDGARWREALAQVGLTGRTELPARALSQGQGRRLALARLIASPRPVWLLDEPAAGLDAAGKAMLRALVERQCAAGGVVCAAVHEPLGLAPAQRLELGA